MGRSAGQGPHRGANLSAPVVIVGIDDERGVHVARTMTRHGIDTIGIAKNPKSFGARTRDCGRIVVADIDTDEVIDRLVALGDELGEQAVLIPCYDHAVSLISEHRERLAERYLFALPEPSIVRLMNDKGEFYRYVEREGFRIPQTFVLQSRDDLVAASTHVRYPCILKPRDSQQPSWKHHSHLKLFRADDEKSLFELYERHRVGADDLLLQDWIRGDDSSVYTCYGYYDVSTEPLVEFTSRKLRQWPPLSGSGCLAVEAPLDDLRKSSARLLKPLRFHGLCSLEVKRDDVDGEFYIIEANIGRATGRCAHVEGSGVEMLLTLYCDLLGLPLPDERFQPFEARKWMNVRRDIMSAFSYWHKGELTLADWFRSARGVSSFALLSRRDPLPFVADVGRNVRRAAAMSRELAFARLADRRNQRAVLDEETQG